MNDRHDRGGWWDKRDATGRLVALWYGGFLCAGALTWTALAESDCKEVAAATLSAAVVILLSLASYTNKISDDEFRRHSVVAAVGPLVVLVMLLEFHEYSRRAEETLAAHLIDSDEVELADVNWQRVPAGVGRLSGVVRNHSTLPLLGLSVELSVFPKLRTASAVTADVEVAVPPGGERSFNTAVPAPLHGPLQCRDGRLSSAPGPRVREASCLYQVAHTRAQIDF